MPKLTKRRVEGATPDESHDFFLWDSELPGFGVRVYPSGRLVYILQYRSNSRRQRRAVIGRHGPLTTEQARAKAREWLAEVAQGGDPAGEAHAARSAPTVAELCDRYLADHASVHKKASDAFDKSVAGAKKDGDPPKILSVEKQGDTKAVAILEKMVTWHSSDGTKTVKPQKERLVLEKVGDEWLIDKFQRECWHCKGQGTCGSCKGTGKAGGQDCFSCGGKKVCSGCKGEKFSE